MTQYHLKRIYDDPDPADGYRVLVDRLWPRGISKADAKLDEWCKDVAPSPELRKDFGHRPEKFDDFAKRYRAELDDSGAAEELRQRMAEHDTVTLLFGAKDVEHNQGVVLLEILQS